MVDPVIGRGGVTPKTTAPIGTGTVLAPNVAPGLATDIATAAKNTKLNIPVTTLTGVSTVNFVTNLTKAQMQQKYVQIYANGQCLRWCGTTQTIFNSDATLLKPKGHLHTYSIN